MTCVFYKGIMQEDTEASENGIPPAQNHPRRKAYGCPESRADALAEG